MGIESFPNLTPTISQVDSTPTHHLGTRVSGYYLAEDRSSTLVYIKAGASLTAGSFYELPLISGVDAFVVDTPLTTALAAALGAVGNMLSLCIPVQSLSVGQYGWAFIRGHCRGLASNNWVIGKPLYTVGTAGAAGDNATTHKIPATFALEDPGNSVGQFYAAMDLHVVRSV